MGLLGFETRPKIDVHKLFVYDSVVIRSFRDPETAFLFATGKARRLPADLLKRATMRLQQLDSALRLDDLRQPPSNRLEALKGDRRGRYSIRINDRWRLCFRFSDGDAFEVEIVDYHR
jgi:proteic killer suppression protein